MKVQINMKTKIFSIVIFIMSKLINTAYSLYVFLLVPTSEQYTFKVMLFSDGHISSWIKFTSRRKLGEIIYIYIYIFQVVWKRTIGYALYNSHSPTQNPCWYKHTELDLLSVQYSHLGLLQYSSVSAPLTLQTAGTGSEF